MTSAVTTKALVIVGLCVTSAWGAPPFKANLNIQFYSKNGPHAIKKAVREILRGQLTDALQFMPSDIQKQILQRDFVIEVLPTPISEVVNRENTSSARFIAPNDPYGPLRIEIRDRIIGTVDGKRLLAHEFFHAAHFVIHEGESSWLWEGLATYFENFVVGSANPANLRLALEAPWTPLMGAYDPNSHSINRSQYGHNYLYIYYLLHECALPINKSRLFWDLVRSTEGTFGTDTVDRALSLLAVRQKDLPHHCRDFQESALTFELAKLLNRVTLQEGGQRDTRYYLMPVDIGDPVYPEPLTTTLLMDLDVYHPLTFVWNEQTRKKILKLKVPHEIKVFWINRDFPYSLQETAPPQGEEGTWRLIYIKTM